LTVEEEDVEDDDSGELVLDHCSDTWLLKFSKLGDVKTGDFNLVIGSLPLSKVKYWSI
jgi:hypothetical protein